MMKSFKDRDESKKYYNSDFKFPKNIKAGSHNSCYEPALFNEF